VRRTVAVAQSTGTAYIPAAADVRLGTNVDATTGTLDLPATTDVKSGVVYDNTTKTGTYSAGGGTYTGAANVRSGTDRGDGTLGTLVVPSAASVLSTATFDNGTAGTYIPVGVANVKAGVTFGAASALTGTCVVPAPANVRSGTNVSLSAGTMVIPSATKVLDDTTYDNGTVGTYHVVLASHVESGVHFGPSSSLVGTLDVSGGSSTTVNSPLFVVDAGRPSNVRTYTSNGGTVLNLTLAQNEGKTLVFVAKTTEDGETTPYDLTGKTVLFNVFEKADDGVIVLTKTTDDATITLTASDAGTPAVLDQVNVVIDTADTATKGAWLWELRVVTDENAYLAGGEWLVKRAPLA
jgi:hypothetical protein